MTVTFGVALKEEAEKGGEEKLETNFIFLECA
jgi:hypothetical protein